MKKLVFSAIVLFSVFSYSQIKFEKGYIILNNGAKVSCYIKNIESRENPEYFEYRLNLDDNNVQLANLNTVSEVAIENSYKYQQHRISIDVSRYGSLGSEREPKWEKKTVFLRVLLEGSASLYHLHERGVSSYFYKKDELGETPLQLVYKDYTQDGVRLRKNESYKQDLFNTLKCESIELQMFEKLNYTEEALIKLFKAYNICMGSEIKTYSSSSSGSFNLKIAPRINIVSNSYSYSTMMSMKASFDNVAQFAFGIEAEYIFGTNKRKWSAFIEPVYQSYEGETTIKSRHEIDGRKTTIEYTSLEIHVGPRHYMYLNDRSKLFLNVAFILDLPLKSHIFIEEISDIDDGKPAPSGAFGIGYNYKNKIDIEIRHSIARNLAVNYNSYVTKYSATGIIVRYNFL